MSSDTYKIIYSIMGVLGFATYILSNPPTWFVGWFLFVLGAIGLGIELLNEKLNGKGRG